MQPETHKGLGPIIALVAILAVVIIGGVYFWSARPQGSMTTSDTASSTMAANTDTQAIESQSSSDDPSSIEADLNATNVDTVDSGLQAQQ